MNILVISGAVIPGPPGPQGPPGPPGPAAGAFGTVSDSRHYTQVSYNIKGRIQR